MHSAMSHLASDLRLWGDQTLPIAEGEAVPAFGLDRPNGTTTRLQDLFFNHDMAHHLVPTQRPEIDFLRGQTLSTQALRNMCFTEILRQHTRVRQLGLHFNVTASFGYEVKTQAPDGSIETVDTGVVFPQDLPPEEFAAPCCHFDLEADIGPQARLFWELEALEDEAVLQDMALSLTAPQDTTGRMVVVMRTFGRSADVLDLLTQFETQSHLSLGLRRALRNMFFLVLDTSPDATSDTYAGLAQFTQLRAHAVAGVNLGGGGNMSQALLCLQDALAESGLAIDELLLLDDDLQVSLESLRRHWAMTLFRADEAIHTLPVCMKTAPRRIWEDGAFWGRFLDPDRSGARRMIAPRLLRHNSQLDDPAHSAALARLHYPEYSTFIFFGLSYARFQTLGYPAAFFLRGDDIEYSLRHGADGGQCLSNPNLCAWHEPAHSYGQEYMSIAHGVIINLCYEGDNRNDFLQFFQQRLAAHSALSDAQGLWLYAHVLADLNTCSTFLAPEFAKHYGARLAAFKAFDANFTYVPKELRDDLHDTARHRGTQLVETSFLYPRAPHNAEASDGPLSRVILHNPHTDGHRVYVPNDPENLSDTVQATAAFATELARFHDQFDALKTHYQAQLQTTASAAFWQEELGRHAPLQTLYSRQETP